MTEDNIKNQFSRNLSRLYEQMPDSPRVASIERLARVGLFIEQLLLDGALTDFDTGNKIIIFQAPPNKTAYEALLENGAIEEAWC